MQTTMRQTALAYTLAIAGVVVLNTAAVRAQEPPPSRPVAPPDFSQLAEESKALNVQDAKLKNEERELKIDKHALAEDNKDLAREEDKVKQETDKKIKNAENMRYVGGPNPQKKKAFEAKKNLLIQQARFQYATKQRGFAIRQQGLDSRRDRLNVRQAWLHDERIDLNRRTARIAACVQAARSSLPPAPPAGRVTLTADAPKKQP